MSDTSPRSGPSPPFDKIYKDFLTYLERVERRNWEDKSFYNPSDIIRWMGTKTSGEKYPNLVKLVSAVYKDDNFPDISADQIEGYQLVFAVLLHPDVNCGNLIHIFRRCNISDKNFDIFSSSNLYKHVVQDLKAQHPALPSNHTHHDYEAVIRAFDQKRWAFCPAQLELHINTTFYGPRILPFLRGEVICKKGGTANLHHYKIHEDLVVCEKLKRALAFSRHKDPKFGWCYEFAVKSYFAGWEDAYHLEREAFKGVRSNKGVVQCLGEYQFKERESTSPNHNIILEYGQQDLDEYLADTFPPVLSIEIVAFWEGLFKVAKTLKDLHRLHFEREDGESEDFIGWHGDIKPDNILRVRADFKLADFGFAKFEKVEIGKLTTHMLGNTQTYGAPECDSTRFGTRTPYLQTIDTWSFGCVLSAVATWVILGSQAYDNYRQFRMLEISDLRQRHENGRSASTPSSSDAFHDGRRVLPAIKNWHTFLRNSSRKSDTISCRVLDLIEDKMLLERPGDRLNLEELCEKLDEIIDSARIEHQRFVDKGKLKVVEPNVLKALLELDKLAPATAAPSAKMGTTQNIKTDELSEQSFKPVLPQGQSPLRVMSDRVGKSERLEKVIVGKTAHREEAINSDLRLNRLTESFEMCESPTEIRSDANQPTSVAQTSAANVLYSSTSINKGKGTIIPDANPTNTSSIAVHSRYAPFTSTRPGLPMESVTEQMYKTFRSPNISTSSHASDEKEAMEPGQSQRNISAELSGESRDLGFVRGNQGQAGHHLYENQVPFTPPPSNRKPTSLNTANQPGFHAQEYGQLPSISPDRALFPGPQMGPRMFSGHSIPGPPEIQITASNNPALVPRQAQPPAIFLEHARLEQLWDATGAFSSFLRKVPVDRYLKNFISDRDIIFVVDNAATMLPYWDVATTVLTTLAMKIGPLDKDGLDLIYTIGDDHNVRQAKGWDIPRAFKSSMQSAGQHIDPRNRTNMSETLQKIFDNYDIRKKTTLIILTNGLWEGLAKENAVETLVAAFVQDLNSKREKKWESRWFSIQFVSFGDDQIALERLRKLDDHMPIADDVIDSKPWDHAIVDNLILGSITDDGDMDPPSPSPSPLSPSSGFLPFSNSASYQVPEMTLSPQSLAPSPSKRFSRKLSSMFK